MTKPQLAEFYKGFKEAFEMGKVKGATELFAVQVNKSVTRYNTSKLKSRLWRYFLEIVTGYGFSPQRTFFTIIAVFLVFSIIPVCYLGLWDGLLLSSGAFFTFGANADKSNQLPILGKLMYLMEPFFGVFLVALLVTVYANYWLTEK